MDDLNFKYFQEIDQKYQKLLAKLEDEKVISNLKLYTELKKELKKIEKTALLFEKWKTFQQKITTWKLIAQNDHQLNSEAQKEITSLKNNQKEIIKQLNNYIQKKDKKNDIKSLIIEIRGAVGGREANLFAFDLFQMYINFCKRQKWKYEIIVKNRSEDGGISSVIFNIKNSSAYSKLRYEGGVHRVQRIPKTETNGRVHTSTATVAVLEEKTFEEVPINDQDLRIDTYRSSGSGGQHVNTTDSAIRILHIPTNIVVTCQDGRSQHDNKENALRVLRARLFKLQSETFQNENISQRNKQIGEGQRSEKIRTYNFPQNRITDHRVNLTIKNIEQIFNGKLENLLDKLLVLISDKND